MEELKEGMYVRTNEGYIAKYNKSKHNCSGKYYGFDSQIRDNSLSECDDCFLWESELDTIIKTSHNLIDLIEVGDYVNGMEVYKDDELDYLYVQCIDGDGNAYQQSITKQQFIDNIKSIVTKEQFEQNSYKVGEQLY